MRALDKSGFAILQAWRYPREQRVPVLEAGAESELSQDWIIRAGTVSR